MQNQILMYNVDEVKIFDGRIMTKIKSNESQETFGKRLARFRNEAGLTQQELADEVAISRRMIAHYETVSETQIDAMLIPKLAKVLGVTTDELLGAKKNKNGKEEKTEVPETRLWKRFRQLQKMPATKRRSVTSMIDAFIDSQKLKQARS